MGTGLCFPETSIWKGWILAISTNSLQISERHCLIFELIFCFRKRRGFAISLAIVIVLTSIPSYWSFPSAIDKNSQRFVPTYKKSGLCSICCFNPNFRVKNHTNFKSPPNINGLTQWCGLENHVQRNSQSCFATGRFFSISLSNDLGNMMKQYSGPWFPSYFRIGQLFFLLP